MDTLKQKAQQIKLLITDVDGVLTDGTLYFSASGEHFKPFHVHDGLGLKLLMEHGIDVAIITSRSSEMVTYRMQELGIKFVYQHQLDKLQAFQDLLTHLSLASEEVAYVGDDLPDLKLISRVGLGIAVANANPLVKQAAMWVTENKGGHGAIRECCDLILNAQNKMSALLKKYL